MKRFPILGSVLGLLAIALPAHAEGLRLRLELWEVPATELAQRMDTGDPGDPGDPWLPAFRRDALTGKSPGVKLLGSSALALAATVTVYQESRTEWSYPMQFETLGLGGPYPKDPARIELWSVAPSTFETRMTGDDLMVRMRPASDTAHWRVTLTGSTSVMHGMRAWGDPGLQISLPVFDFLRLDHIVILPLSQWRILFLGPVSSAPPPGPALPGPVANPQDIAASRQVRRLMLVRLEPND